MTKLDATNVQVVNDSAIVCTAPRGTGYNVISITVDTLNGQTDRIFAYHSPVINSTSFPPLLGGIVTLVGSNFGFNSSLASVVVDDRSILNSTSLNIFLVVKQ